MMNWYHDGGMDGSSFIYMSLMWVVLIGIGIVLVRWTTHRDRQSNPQETPRQILDRRLASGDLTQAEYAKSRHLIDGHGLDS